MSNSHGGRRAGAGRKATWKHGACKAIKIPLPLVDEVVRYARQLDDGHAPLNEKHNQERDMPAALSKTERWAQVKALVEEKQELARQLQHLRNILGKERKTKEMQDEELARARARIADAQSILKDGLSEYRKGIRKTFGIKDVKSALLALGYDADLN